MMRKVLMLGAAIIMMSGNVWAQKTGSCGEDCIYMIDDAGNVVVSGSGTLGSLQGVPRESIKSLTIEYGFEAIGNSAFWNTNIESVVIPDSVTSIGENAFYRIPTLKKIEIPKSVTTIENGAFADSKVLDEVIIQGDVTLNGTNVFYGSPVNKISYNSVTYSCGEACSTTLYNDGSALFKGEGTLERVSAPMGLRNNFNEVSSVYIEGFSTIGYRAFDGFKNIKNAVLSDSVTTVGDQAFSATGLENINMTDSVVSIDRSFYGCHDLKSIVIPESVTSIHSRAFWDTNLLTAVYCSVEQQNMCKAMAKENGKDQNLIGFYKKKGKKILYYDSTGKFVYNEPNPKYKPKKIYTIEEAMEATKEGDKFHVYLTYK